MPDYRCDEKNRNTERQRWNEKSAAQSAGRSYYRLYIKVGSYNTYVWHWRVLTPQVITFDPEEVRP
jgi:hypothetical protein